ncbi:MAG: ATP-grasp domain-containing protein [Ignavibacteriae bacterium]|jgi:carbamoyl-phosphate synthase large subunit|nr:ATP-grasp domain-containing protein [Ignavibacteriota bacterium]
MNKKKITVAVTGLNNTDNPGPGIPVIRGIRDSKYFNPRIIGLAYENLEPGIYMHDQVNKSYQIPYPTMGSDALMKRLEYINSIEKIDVLIPNFDAELYTFMKSADRLRKLGIRTFLPTLGQFEERHKSVLPAFGKKYGIKVPDSRVLFSENDIASLKDDFTYPLLVKGQYYDAYVAQNPEQAKSYFHKIVGKWGLPIIIQEYVSGTEVNVVALGDGLGNTIGAVPMRKQYITDKGKAWAGIALGDQYLLDITNRLIKRTKWQGGMELEMIKTVKNVYYLIEINPRLPAWVYLAVGAGQNLPEALVKLALGMKVKPFGSYEVGKLFIRYSYDLICDLSEFEQLSLNSEL